MFLCFWVKSQKGLLTCDEEDWKKSPGSEDANHVEAGGRGVFCTDRFVGRIQIQAQTPRTAGGITGHC